MAGNIAPGLLVAAPSLLDPNFQRSVVLLVDHNAEGSLGFVINRASPVDFREVVREMKLVRAEPEVDLPIFVGGPVAPETGWILLDRRAPHDLAMEDLVEVGDQMAVSASRDLLAAIARGVGPTRCLLLLGYAGWSAGQLDEELEEGIWLPADLDERLVFDAEPEDKWRLTLKSLGVDPGRLIGSPSTPPGAKKFN